MDQQVKAAASAAQGIPMPAIGQALADGIFAGIVRGENGCPDVALVDLGFLTDKPANWKRAGELAAEKGATLPTRQEARVLWANVDFGAKTYRWFWTSTQYAGSAVYAWFQNFGDGLQTNDPKDYEYNVRAVRRLPLQSFSDSGS